MLLWAPRFSVTNCNQPMHQLKLKIEVLMGDGVEQYKYDEVKVLEG